MIELLPTKYQNDLTHEKIIVFVIAGILVASSCHAENRLFPTAILNQGEVDAAIFASHDTHSSNLNFLGNAGSQSSNNTTESIEARYGLGANWQIGASLHYRSQGVIHTNFSNPSAHFSNRSGEGSQNPTLRATYGIVNDKANSFSLNGELLIKPKMTDHASSYAGRLSAGWKTSDTLKIYAEYMAIAETDSSTAESNRISVGAYKDISNSITLIPFASYTRFNSTNAFSSAKQYSIGLSANIELFKNTYLIPTIAHYENSSANSKDGFFHLNASGNGTAIRLGLYHLF